MKIGNRRGGVLPMLCLLLACAGSAQERSTIPTGHLDPTRDIAVPQLFSSLHKPLPEEYIWTRQDSAIDKPARIVYKRPGVDERTEPHYFRASFDVEKLPAEATLYLAGPRSARVYVNGQIAGHFASNLLNPLGMHVFRRDVTKLLRPGRNVVAMEVVRGRGVSGFLNSALALQQVSGQVLVAKILPEPPGVDGKPLLISGAQWKGTLHPAAGWEQAQYDDSSWPAVAALSPIEGSIDLFQWNADAGLYDWPGYEGASPFLAHAYFHAARVEDVETGRSSFANLDALTKSAGAGEFTVKLGNTGPGLEDAPELTLDFGREVTGRVELVSDSDSPVTVSIQYGESKGEVDRQPYLGVNMLRLAAHGAGHGPKSAFRYALIRFLSRGPELKFRAIHLEDIYYPVRYQAEFQSSDPLLNRIWETGAYTVHLCMQDDIWDAPKRDRGRWMGDLDVSGRVSDAVFSDRFLLKDTLTRLIGNAPVQQHVNGIPGYSSFWPTELEDYEWHTGDRAYLKQVHTRLVELLQYMDREFDSADRFTDRTNAWLFVDWAPGLQGDNPETQLATTLQYYRAYIAGAHLLRVLGDSANAAHYEQRAAEIKATLQRRTWQPAEGNYGPRVQTNAMAVLSGVAAPSQYASIWKSVLAEVGQPTFRPDIMTPYYGAYVLDAMAKMNHRAEALRWMREYWGGMIAEGATSFWEAYDPSWPKGNPHVALQADRTAGYFVSLAHGWSAGPTYWLMQQVLGIQPVAEGFSHTVLRPDLVGLKWARGYEQTPQGPLKVDLCQDNGLVAVIDLPNGVVARVLFPVAKGTDYVLVNGSKLHGTPVEGGSRVAIQISASGHYEIREP